MREGALPTDAALPVSPPEDTLLGQLIGPYRLERLLGEGGFGRVYLGLHTAIGSQVAIKVLLPGRPLDEELTGRFLNEARAVNLIRHEGIVNVFDLGTLPDGHPY